MVQSAASVEPRRVLLVEDDDGDATIVSDLLVEAWPVLRVDRATELAEAERRLGAADCVLLDLGLPDALGIEAVRRLREADPEMPVVVLTGDADEQRGIQALGAGAQDYLIKGTISGASLARAIRHSVQRKLAERFERELAVLRVQSAENARVQRGLVPARSSTTRGSRSSAPTAPATGARSSAATSLTSSGAGARWTW